MLCYNYIPSRLLLILFFFVPTVVTAQDPNPPLITHVSVLEDNQQVEINWINSSNQVVGYIIYFQDISGLWIPLDTVQGISNTSYITTNANPQLKNETYSVVAFDAIGNNSIRSESHSTILLDYTYSNCDTSVVLTWNSYENMVGLNNYQLNIQKKDSESGLIIATDSINLGLLDTSYNYPVDYSSEYTFWIKANSSSIFFSNSNKKWMFSTNVDLPTFSYINRVSVVGENNIEISAVTNSTDVQSLKIFRSYVSNGFQFYIGQALANGNEFTLNDQLVLPDRNVYYYTSRPVDKCGKEYILPKFDTTLDTCQVQNLQLKSLEIDNEKISVLCGEYDFFLEPSNMELWKSVNGDDQMIKDVLPNSIHEISIIDDYGEICLYTIAKEQNINALNIQDRVFSNKLCVSKVPKFFIPNSFSPNGDAKNDVWQVFVYSESSVSSFNLKIMNRWGQTVFQSNSIQNGWNGMINNTIASDGIYFFDVFIYYSDNQSVRQTGALHLIR